jgi:hypothetical protein
MRGGWRLVGIAGIRIGIVVLRHADELAGARDVVGAGGSGEQAVVADAVEAFGQDVAQETADELTGGKRHPLVSGAAVGAIVLVAEGDAVLVERDQPAVGDGDAVGVARQIGEHRLGSAERGLCIDVPGDPAQRRQVGREGLALGEELFRCR